jgi:hypothetical protein
MDEMHGSRHPRRDINNSRIRAAAEPFSMEHYSPGSHVAVSVSIEGGRRPATIRVSARRPDGYRSRFGARRQPGRFAL